jgi:hypothetical protein
MHLPQCNMLRRLRGNHEPTRGFPADPQRMIFALAEKTPPLAASASATGNPPAGSEMDVAWSAVVVAAALTGSEVPAFSTVGEIASRDADAEGKTVMGCATLGARRCGRRQPAAASRRSGQALARG